MRRISPSEATVVPGSANTHYEKKAHLSFLWQVSEVDAEGTKVYASQSGVGGSDLLRRPSKTRSHMTASPLILTPGNFEVLKVPTWLEAFENGTQIESHSPTLY